MLSKINSLDGDAAKRLLDDFFSEYLKQGFGVLNKTEIETLFYHVFRKHNLLSGKCFEDSIVLKIPETKARKLNYDSQVKYANRSQEEIDIYLRNKVGECLEHAELARSGKCIKFAIEDKFVRTALLAKLRSNYYFADSSFNTDIITMNENTFGALINLLVPNDKVADVKKHLTDHVFSET